MYISVLVFWFLIPFCCSHISPALRYECGAHGKFEYCIDDIPGCVIGCHCHPGYYFDTDSKICEPNIKLIPRQNFYGEHTRAYAPTATSTTIPTLTTTIKIIKVANDTDGLSDWLYNQFFKTVENQVINNTNLDKQFTRRKSSVGSINNIKKPKRLTRKSSKVSKKKKKKERGLKRKLLRITEDDSLFETDTETDTDSDSDSDSDSTSDDSDDSDDSDTDSDKEKKRSKERKSDHGHKKLIIYNKRPKLPLPSFIFLPNMDTPYYPPIGLPPPPVMAMNPMLPIPPMAPILPFPAICQATTSAPVTTQTPKDETTTSATVEDTTVHKNGDVTKEVTNTESTDKTTEMPSTEPSEADEAPTQETADDSTTQTNDPSENRYRKKYLRAKPARGRRRKLTPEQKLKLIRKLQANIGSRRQLMPVEDYLDETIPSDEIYQMDETYTSPETPRKDIENNNIPDIDFKYLSELIHRANVNEANKLTSKPLYLPNGRPLDNSQYSRKNNPYLVESATPLTENRIIQPRRLHVEGPDDSYYSNLGRQIASMIRTADARTSNPKPEQTPVGSVFNDHNLMPRSYWDRSVRSPLNKLKQTIDKYQAKHSPEKELLNLENEVRTHSVMPLSLLDLEDIFSKMQMARSKINNQNNKMNTPDSHVNLNINLLPSKQIINDSHRNTINTQFHTRPAARKHTKSNTEIHQKLQQKPLRAKNKPSKKLTQRLTDKTKLIPHRIDERRLIEAPKQHSSTRINPYETEFINGNFIPKKQIDYLHFLRTLPIPKHNARKPEYKFPVFERNFDSYQPFNYFSGNKHKYVLGEVSYPDQISTLKTNNMKPLVNAFNPSYFHHEVHEYQYFD